MEDVEKDLEEGLSGRVGTLVRVLDRRGIKLAVTSVASFCTCGGVGGSLEAISFSGTPVDSELGLVVTTIPSRPVLIGSLSLEESPSFGAARSLRAPKRL